jgi:hypothetical protein
MRRAHDRCDSSSDPVHATAGIPQYIVADLVNNRVLLHANPGEDAYSQVTVLTRGDRVEINVGNARVLISATQFLP